MLQKIRDSLQGWIAYTIVAILVVPFAFWGIGDYLGFFDEPFAAKVNDVEIPQARFQDNFNQRYAQLRDAYGEDFDPDLIDEDSMRQEVLDRMITEEVLYQYALEQGFRISDERLAREIHAIESFQEDGEFSPERYSYLLQLNNQTPARFENLFRRSLVIGQLEEAVTGTAFMPDGVVESLVEIADQRREVAWVDLHADDFRAGIEVSDAEVEEYYEANAGRFMTPETVELAYVDLTIDEAAAEVEVDENELRLFYQERLQQIAADEERRARHILVTDDGRDDDEARALAEELQARIEAGESFEALAREHSDDRDSAADGGSLGWVARGVLGNELDSELFTLEPGEVSEPVRTGFGWHILRVDEVRGTEPPSFESMRDELAADYRQREAERRFYDLVERMADLAYENPDNLDAIVESLGLEVETIPGVTPDSGEGLARLARVRNAAFSSEVLEERYNSSLIELDDDRVVVLRVTDHQLPQRRPLAEVAGEIRETLVANEARRRAAAAGEEIVERARAGEPLRDLAAELGGEWTSARLVSRADQDTPRELIGAAFRAPRPGDEPVIRGLRVRDNDYAVFQLLSVVPGAPEGLSDEDLQNFRTALAQRKGNAEFTALVENLRDEAEISYGSRETENDSF